MAGSSPTTRRLTAAAVLLLPILLQLLLLLAPGRLFFLRELAGYLYITLAPLAILWLDKSQWDKPGGVSPVPLCAGALLLGFASLAAALYGFSRAVATAPDAASAIWSAQLVFLLAALAVGFAWIAYLYRRHSLPLLLQSLSFVFASLSVSVLFVSFYTYALEVSEGALAIVLHQTGAFLLWGACCSLGFLLIGSRRARQQARQSASA